MINHRNIPCSKCGKEIELWFRDRVLCQGCYFKRQDDVRERHNLTVGQGPYRQSTWYLVEIGEAPNKIEAGEKFMNRHKGYPIIRSSILFDEETGSWWCNYLLDSSD